jgi:imidazolonepropionase-like amidohydrolase
MRLLHLLLLTWAISAALLASGTPPAAGSCAAPAGGAAAATSPAAAASAATAPAAAPTPASQAMPFVVRGARVFDGSRGLGVSDVLVRDGRIAAVGRDLSVPAGTVEVSGAGRTLLPGLIDSHTHTWGAALHQALIFGVTTELDMFTNAQVAAAVKADQAAGRRLDEADLRSAGTLATAPGGHGTEYGFAIPTLTRPEEAEGWVDKRVAEGSDYIKIVIEDGRVAGLSLPTLDAATVAALVAAAHRHGKLAVVHVETLAAAREAIDAGADGLAHLFVDQLPDPEFGRFVAAHHAFVIPTLSVLRGVTGTTAGTALVDDPHLAPYISPDNAANLQHGFPARPGRIGSYPPAVAAIGQLAAAGVPMLAGTDAPNPGTAHGISLHGELALLVEAGLTPVQALAAATSVPAAIFHLDDRGRIAAGRRADLVLVAGDPTTDILQTRAIERVWKLGVAVDRDAYRAEVASARAVQAAMGRGWAVSTDQIAGGHSTATLAAVEDAELASADAVKAGTTAGNAGAATASAAAGNASAAAVNAGTAGAGMGRTLQVAGRVAPGGFFSWAGAAFQPAESPLAPVDMSQRQGIHFWAKGDGRTYQVMVFAKSRGRIPLLHAFTAEAGWKRYDLPWSSFNGYDGHDVQLVVFAAVTPPGDFAFRLAGVGIE